MSIRTRIQCCAPLLLAGMFIGSPTATAGDRPSPSQGEALNLGLKGVHFVPNAGQWADEEVHYGFKSRGLDVAFRESGLTMHLRRERKVAQASHLCEEPATVAQASRLCDPGAEPVEYEQLMLTVTFPGSNVVVPSGTEPQQARFNYYIGDDESAWASDVQSFARVIYEDLYDGIDLHVMGSADGVLKYEFHCEPGADYEQIRVQYDGIDGLCVDGGGDLLIETAFGTLRDGKPAVWQDDPSETIAARFEVVDGGTYTVVLEGMVDDSLPVVIDPEVEWMLYLGGTRWDSGEDIAIDRGGNVLVTGYTDSVDFEGMKNDYYGGGWDAFVLKAGPAGQLLWASYFGGSSVDFGYGMVIDTADNALVAGVTASADFAGQRNSYSGDWDAFTLMINPSGRLEWMIYLGGSGSEDGYRMDIVLDNAGDVLVAGSTSSTDFVGRTNSYYGDGDAFTLKVTPTGQVDWMTYLGGTDSDDGRAIAVDSDGNALVSGDTFSTDFAGRNNSFRGDDWADAFALKISPSGTLEWMTYLGGDHSDRGTNIAEDRDGNVLVTGYTRSDDFDGRNNTIQGWSDIFLVKLSPAGILLWMTYLGGSGNDVAGSLAMDRAGNLLITGHTRSYDFVSRTNSKTYGNIYDVFTLSVSPSGVPQWMIYLGGYEDDIGRDIALNSADDVMLTGTTYSYRFAGQRNRHHGGETDAFLVKVKTTPSLLAEGTCPDGGPIQVSWEGATPDGEIAILYARNSGLFTIPKSYPCAGTELALRSDQIHLAWRGPAGPDGSGTLNADAPPAACGRFVQLLDLTTCATSNVVVID